MQMDIYVIVKILPIVTEWMVSAHTAMGEGTNFRKVAHRRIRTLKCLCDKVTYRVYLPIDKVGCRC